MVTHPPLIHLLHIAATQDLPCQSSELPKVALPFAIQEPEAPGDTLGAVINLIRSSLRLTERMTFCYNLRALTLSDT
jgi:hypothetical protein